MNPVTDTIPWDRQSYAGSRARLERSAGGGPSGRRGAPFYLWVCVVVGCFAQCLLFPARAQETTVWPWPLEGASEPKPQTFEYVTYEATGEVLLQVSVTLSPRLSVEERDGKRYLRVTLGENQVDPKQVFKRRDAIGLDFDYEYTLFYLQKEYAYQEIEAIFGRFSTVGGALIERRSNTAGVIEIPEGATLLESLKVLYYPGSGRHEQQVTFIFGPFAPPPTSVPLGAVIGVGLLAVLFGLGLDLLPGVGTVKGVYEAYTGRDAITGQELAWWERLLGIVPVAGGVVGAGVAVAVVAGRRAGDVADAAADVARAAEAAGELADARRTAEAAGEVADAGRAAEAAGELAGARRSAEDVASLVSKYGDNGGRILKEYGDDLGGDVLSIYDEIADIDGADQLMQDLLSGTGINSTRQGALSEIGYAASLRRQGEQIEKIGDMIPVQRGNKLVDEKAGDILIKDGPIIDVKDYNWSSWFYQSASNIEKEVVKLVKQVNLHKTRYPGRPIEYAFTDLAKTPSQIVEALVEAGVDVKQVTWVGR